MDRKTSVPSFLALANASSPQGYQFTGLCACWSRYGLLSLLSLLVCLGGASFGPLALGSSAAGASNTNENRADRHRVVRRMGRSEVSGRREAKEARPRGPG